jgi:hypothetical protein
VLIVKARSVTMSVTFPVLWLGWLCAPPILFVVSVLTSFGGELTADQEATASRLMAGASLCWFGLPVLGLVLALVCRRQVATTFFLWALAVTLAATGLGKLYGF